jgi:hypothetical protein
MKSLKVYDPTHLEVKLEAVRQQRSVPNLASELLNAALALFRAGKLKLSEPAETETASSGK